MSRIGKQPVPVPQGVDVTVRDGRVVVKGPKGTLEERLVPYTSVELSDGLAVVNRESDEKSVRAAHGLMRALLANMIMGVTTGFEKSLELVGVGYRAEVKGTTVTLRVGYSHPVEVETPAGLEVVAESQTRLVVRGNSKQRVGQLAADIRKVRPPEPYKGKGIRYVGEHVRRKVGKTGVGS
jgi:large subunit ribosomal protein L6